MLPFPSQLWLLFYVPIPTHLLAFAWASSSVQETVPRSPFRAPLRTALDPVSQPTSPLRAGCISICNPLCVPLFPICPPTPPGSAGLGLCLPDELLYFQSLVQRLAHSRCARTNWMTVTHPSQQWYKPRHGVWHTDMPTYCTSTPVQVEIQVTRRHRVARVRPRSLEPRPWICRSQLSQAGNLVQ